MAKTKKAGWLLLLSLVLLGHQAALAQDQKFALRFGLVGVHPDSDFERQGGGEVGFEWYFHPRVGFEVTSMGAAEADRDPAGEVIGVAFSTFTLGINGHVLRSEKVDFAVGILGGGTRYSDFEVSGSTTTIDTERDSAIGLQAFVDMSVGRRWAVDVGLKYLDASVDVGFGRRADFDPVIGRVLGVYRWGGSKKGAPTTSD